MVVFQEHEARERAGLPNSNSRRFECQRFSGSREAPLALIRSTRRPESTGPRGLSPAATRVVVPFPEFGSDPRGVAREPPPPHAGSEPSG